MTSRFVPFALLGLSLSLAGCGCAGAPAEVDAAGVDAASPVDAALDTGGSDAGSDAAADARVDGGACAPLETASSCRVGTDCTGGELCVPPGGSLGCGECVMPMALCATTADCAPTDACVFFTPVCSCGGQSSECRPRCTATSCATGETCDLTGGICEPTSCSAGYTCPAHTTCAPGASADLHGCDRDSCSVDGDCDCGGGCVGGYCYAELGTCTLAPP